MTLNSGEIGNFYTVWQQIYSENCVLNFIRIAPVLSNKYFKKTFWYRIRCALSPTVLIIDSFLA